MPVNLYFFFHFALKMRNLLLITFIFLFSFDIYASFSHEFICSSVLILRALNFIQSCNVGCNRKFLFYGINFAHIALGGYFKLKVKRTFRNLINLSHCMHKTFNLCRFIYLSFLFFWRLKWFDFETFYFNIIFAFELIICTLTLWLFSNLTYSFACIGFIHVRLDRI